jgi:DNA (cytosine-5)-methyltransferase 1
MMGLPAGWVTDPAIGISRSAQLKACGDGVVPQQAIAALEHMLNAHLRTTPA